MKNFRLRPEVRQVCGLPLLTLEAAVPRRRRDRRRWARALARLHRSGVERVVVQGPLPAELLTAAGLCPVDCGPLRQALLEPLLDYFVQVRGISLQGATVVLRALQTDAAARRAAVILTRRARYVALETGAGQDLLAEELRRRFGLGSAPSFGAVLWVCMEGATASAGPSLYLGGESRQRLHLSAPWLSEGEEMLFSVLFETGKVKTEEITIKSVEFYS